MLQANADLAAGEGAGDDGDERSAADQRMTDTFRGFAES